MLGTYLPNIFKPWKSDNGLQSVGHLVIIIILKLQ